MSKRIEFESLLQQSVRVRPATSELADRVSARVLSRLESRAPQRQRRPWVLVAAAAAAVVLLAWLLRDERLTPALQLSRMAVAAESIELSHWVLWTGAPGRELEQAGEMWVQPPLYKYTVQRGEVRQSMGFDGLVSWEYDTFLRKVSVRRDQSPWLDGLPRLEELQHELERNADEGAVTLDRILDDAGRAAIRLIGTNTGLGERTVAYVDPATDLPYRIEVFKLAAGGDRSAPDAPWTHRQRFDITYPAQPLPPAFFQCDAPPDYPRVELPPLPAKPSLDEVRARLNGPGVDTLAAPSGASLRLVDVARSGDLLFVGFVLEGSEAKLISVKPFSTIPNGLLRVAGFVRAPKTQPTDPPLLAREGTVHGEVYCLTRPDAAVPTITKVEAFAMAGRQSQSLTFTLAPDQVRVLSGPPEWWSFLHGGSAELLDQATRVRATHWLQQAPSRAVAYAEQLTAEQAGPVNGNMCRDWLLLAEARARTGDKAGALAAIDRGLALVPGLDPRMQDRMRDDLAEQREAIEGGAAP